MRIGVIGSSGRTGGRVVGHALHRGHDVVAVARHLHGLSARVGSTDRLELAATDVLDEPALVRAVAGCDAVVSALGIGTSRAPTTVYSRGVTNILAAMAVHHLTRLSVVSAAPVGPRTDDPRLQRLVVLPVLDRVFGATYADMARMEAVLGRSELDWTCLRPPRLVDRAATGTYRVDTAAPPPRGGTLTFADLADALLDALDRTELFRRPAYVAN